MLRVGKNSIERVMTKILPYYAVICIVLMAITYLPFLSSWLPHAAGYDGSMGSVARSMLGAG